MNDIILIECGALLLNSQEGLYIKNGKMYKSAPFELKRSKEFSNIETNIMEINFLFCDDIDDYQKAVDYFFKKEIIVSQNNNIFKGIVNKITSKTTGFEVIVSGFLRNINAFVNKKYSNQCRAIFCDEECSLSLQENTFVTNVKNIDGMKILLQDVPPNKYWSGGNVILQNGKRLMIRSISLNELLLFEFADVNIDDEIKIVPTCDKNLSTCGRFYNNVVNFRGEPFIMNSLN